MKYQAEVKITVDQIKDLIAKEFGVDKKSVQFFLTEHGDNRDTWKEFGGATFSMTITNPVADSRSGYLEVIAR